MKKNYILLLMLILSLRSYAQVPNYSFENWINTSGILNPQGWMTNNYFASNNNVVVPSVGDAYEGDTALKFQVDGNGSGTYSGYMETGNSTYLGFNTTECFAITTKPLYLTGWYIFNQANDSDYIFVGSYVKCANGGGKPASLANAIYTPTSTYKQFSFAYSTYTNDCYDSANIKIGLLYKGEYEAHATTYAILDDIEFSQNAAIKPIMSLPSFEQCYPNPANDLVTVIYTIPTDGKVTLTLYDMLGRVVKTLIDNENQSPGRYKVPFNSEYLNSGVYFYELTVNGQRFAQKFAVTH